MSGARGSEKPSVHIRDIPPELVARVPAEQRGPGLGRDSVRLLVSPGAGAVSLHAFRELPGLLRAGDVLVVNTSATLPAALDARLGGEDVVVHFSTRGEDRRWAVELVAALVSRGVQFAPLTLHTGVASQEAHEPPYPEWYAVPGTTAWLVNAARAAGAG